MTYYVLFSTVIIMIMYQWYYDDKITIAAQKVYIWALPARPNIFYNHQFNQKLVTLLCRFGTIYENRYRLTNLKGYGSLAPVVNLLFINVNLSCRPSYKALLFSPVWGWVFIIHDPSFMLTHPGFFLGVYFIWQANYYMPVQSRGYRRYPTYTSMKKVRHVPLQITR